MTPLFAHTWGSTKVEHQFLRKNCAIFRFENPKVFKARLPYTSKVSFQNS